MSAALGIAHRTGHGADLWDAGELLRRVAGGELAEMMTVFSSPVALWSASGRRASSVVLPAPG